MSRLAVQLGAIAVTLAWTMFLVHFSHEAGRWLVDGGFAALIHPQRPV